jgi:glycosyltransferase involved in cell wall biosynthesis
MNIVWVKAGGLLPVNTGGRSRSYHLLRWLAQRHSVSIFTFYAAQPDDPHPALREPFARVESLALDLPAKGSLSDYWIYGRSVLAMQSYALTKFYRRSVANRLRSFLRAPCDVIVCDFLFSAPVIPWDTPCPKVFFTHNVEAIIWKRHFHIAKNPLWKAVCWREWKLTARAERKYLREADSVLAVSEADRNTFAEWIDPRKISVIPTGVDTEYFHPSPGKECRDCLVFTGSMDWLANEDAMVYFVNEVLPLIRQRIPNVSLWIVGRSPTRPIQELSSQHKNVRVTGTVEDVRPYIAKAEVYVVPIRAGSGTRLKIFEAMAMAKPVVSTSIGAEGLPVSHGKDIVLADSREDFAEAVVALLGDANYREALGQAARGLVASKHSWSSVGSVFEESLRRSIHRPDLREAR